MAKPLQYSVNVFDESESTEGIDGKPGKEKSGKVEGMYGSGNLKDMCEL